MSKTVICVVYVDDCFLWECSQYDIDNVTKSFKDYRPSKNCEHSKGKSVSEFLFTDLNTFGDGGFHFLKLDLSVKSWKPQERIIVIGCQHPPRLKCLMGHTRTVLMLIDIIPTQIILF